MHPECGCASQAMAFGERPHAHPLDRGHGRLRPASSPKQRFLVATETGILHRLSKEAPGKRFEPVDEAAVCRFMKMITLEKARDSLRDRQYEVTVEPEIAARARGAIDRMVAIGLMMGRPIASGPDRSTAGGLGRGADRAVRGRRRPS